MTTPNIVDDDDDKTLKLLTAGGGADDCPCIDLSSKFAALEDCESLSAGIPGVWSGNTCLPFEYGSTFCKKHDEMFDPKCKQQNNNRPPDYCYESFCYVDPVKCRRSKEQFFLSDFFSDHGFYYSYSTCNSSELAWLRYKTTERLQNTPELRVTIPGSLFPHHFKRTEDGEIASFSGPEYYNSSIPFQGAFIDYMEKVAKFSDDINAIEYLARSGGSDVIHPLSSFTASARDVQYGLSDLSIGPFWITSERLQMVPFTTTIAIDKTFLVVKEPEKRDSLFFQFRKVMQPFDYWLWFWLTVTIVVVGALSIWFASPNTSDKGPWIAFRNDKWRDAPLLLRLFICYRQLFESALRTGVDFFSAAATYDHEATMSHKILMFGFSFLTLISIAAYTANLAAFLTLSGVSEYIDSMDKAIARNVKICAHPVVRSQLQSSWPDAHFVFNTKTGDYVGLFESYDEKKCEALAMGWLDVRYDEVTMQMMCDRNMVFTKGQVIETPMAFPVSSELSAGISYWLVQAERELKFTANLLLENYEPSLECEVEVTATETDADDLASLTTKNLAFPFTVLIVCAIVATAKKIFDTKQSVKAAHRLAKMSGIDPKSSQIFVDMAKYAQIDINDLDEYNPSTHDLNIAVDEEEDSWGKDLGNISNVRKRGTALSSSATKKQASERRFHFENNIGNNNARVGDNRMQMLQKNFGQSLRLMQQNNDTPNNTNMHSFQKNFARSMRLMHIEKFDDDNNAPLESSPSSVTMMPRARAIAARGATMTPGDIMSLSKEEMQDMIQSAVNKSVKNTIETAVRESVTKAVEEIQNTDDPYFM